ncbi:hypothetical protein [Dyadobacter sp.]|uniref:hypothetical protein n=1 Tax=Dyadobacter sp. TaxID=1914288 RepID=UPI003F70944E
MMKITHLSAFLILAAFAIFLACERKSDEPGKPSFIEDATNLADQTDGFYSKVAQVSVAKGSENGQHMLQLTLSNSDLLPQSVKIYFEDENWEKVNLQSGQYEVLFLKYALIVNDPMSGKRQEFIVNAQQLSSVLEKLPKNFLSASAVPAIGIAVYGQHSALKEGPNLVPDCPTSGGTGTISCSNSCCSITCNSGYYATCAGSCSCSKTPKDL